MKKKYLIAFIWGVTGTCVLSGQAIAQIKQIDCKSPVDIQEFKGAVKTMEDFCSMASARIKETTCSASARMKTRFEACTALSIEDKVDRFSLVLDSGKFGGKNVTAEYTFKGCAVEGIVSTSKMEVEITPSFLLFNRSQDDRVTINRESLTAASKDRGWTCSVTDVAVKNKI
jgi:hypothetical protein